MQGNFTERTRNVLAFAREEAARLHHEYVGTEHLLLALLRDDGGVGAAVLSHLGADVNAIRQRLDGVVPKGDPATPVRGEAPFATRAKRAIELSTEAARDLGHTYVGTEHLLLALLREESGIAAEILREANITLESARAETVRLVGTPVLPTHTGNGGSDPHRTTRGDFTQRVRRILTRARDEAARMQHAYVGTHHILLAMLRDDNGVAIAVLKNLGLGFTGATQQLEQRVEEGDSTRPTPPDFPYTARAKHALEFARASARELTHSYIGTEHVLIGLLRESDSVAAEVLRDANITEAAARAETLRLLGTEIP